jgi:hypothetical protein
MLIDVGQFAFSIDPGSGNDGISTVLNTGWIVLCLNLDRNGKALMVLLSVFSLAVRVQYFCVLYVV